MAALRSAQLHAKGARLKVELHEEELRDAGRWRAAVVGAAPRVAQVEELADGGFRSSEAVRVGLPLCQLFGEAVAHELRRVVVHLRGVGRRYVRVR